MFITNISSISERSLCYNKKGRQFDVKMQNDGKHIKIAILDHDSLKRPREGAVFNK